jgi:hypothetical protein
MMGGPVFHIERENMKKHITTENFTMKPEEGNLAVKQSVCLPVDIPINVSLIRIELKFSSKYKTQIPLAVFEPDNTLRGIGIHEYSTGVVTQELWLAIDSAGKGAVQGSIPSGTWKLLIYGRYMFEEVHCSISVFAEYGFLNAHSSNPNIKPDLILDSRKGWYCGELHMHSRGSTGRTDVETLARIASVQKLDFIAITDHFSIAHWEAIDKLPGDRRPLIIHSCELSGEGGHANLHGISEWISPFVDLDEETSSILGLEGYDMNSVADMVHDQGGLFCINHPLSAKVGWKYYEFPWEKADLIEVIGLPDGPNSFLYPVLWDRLLCEGHHITGIGSSDSHDPLSDGPWKLGMVRNWVWAENLSEQAVLAGLKKGNVYISYGETRLNFTAGIPSEKDNSLVTGMGETLSFDKEEILEFTVSLMNQPEGSLYIIKDGLIFDVFHVKKCVSEDKWFSIVFQAKGASFIEGKDSYFRVEFHEEIVEPYYVNMAYRDHTSARALSNPVWIKKTCERQRQF